jgi:DNA repair protein RecO (recombination protein O)
MNTPKNYTVEGIVLKRVDFDEKDRLVTMLSPNHGKIRAIAKGCRRPGSKLCGHLEIFSHGKFYLARGRNLDIITQIEAISSNQKITCDLDLISWVFYLAEVINIFATEGEENYDLFRLLTEIISELPGSQEKELSISLFEYKLISLLGYQPDFKKCVLSGDDLTDEEICFCSNKMGLAKRRKSINLSDSVPIENRTMHCLQWFEEHQSLPDFSKGDKQVQEEVRFITQSMIEQISEKRLNSLDFRQDIAMMAS